MSILALWLKRGFIGGFNPASLFATGAQGAWYDPSDYSTLFQDAAGTTPVTAVEQPVRLMRDKSGRGNHATAPSDPARPILRARYNLLTYSEQFDNAAWTKSNITATANTDTAPDETLTADTLAATGANGTTLSSFTAQDASYTFSVWLKRKTGTGNVDISAHSGGTWVTQTITSSWARYTVTQTLTAGARTPGIRIVTSGDEVYIWGAQLLTAADQTATGGAYQRIAAATDYDTIGFRPYLAFDGIDDSLLFSTVTSNTGMSLIVGGAVQNTPPVASIFDGAVFIGRYASSNSEDISLGIRNNGSIIGVSCYAESLSNNAEALTSGYITGANCVAYGDASSAATRAALNGGALTATTAVTNTLRINFLGWSNNSPIVMLTKLQGRIYGVIAVARVISAAERASTEIWLAAKTGVTL